MWKTPQKTSRYANELKNFDLENMAIRTTMTRTNHKINLSENGRAQLHNNKSLI